jgi:hypothetical protein
VRLNLNACSFERHKRVAIGYASLLGELARLLRRGFRRFSDLTKTVEFVDGRLISWRDAFADRRSQSRRDRRRITRRHRCRKPRLCGRRRSILARPTRRKLPTVATRDIATAAARLLLDTSWSGAGHVAVLDPEDLSFNEMAQIVTGVLGKPVRYQQITAAALRERLIKAGMSEAMAQGTADMMAAKNEGLDNAEPRTPESSSPTSFRQWTEQVLKPAVLSTAAMS